MVRSRASLPSSTRSHRARNSVGEEAKSDTQQPSTTGKQETTEAASPKATPKSRCGRTKRPSAIINEQPDVTNSGGRTVDATPAAQTGTGDTNAVTGSAPKDKPKPISRRRPNTTARLEEATPKSGGRRVRSTASRRPKKNNGELATDDAKADKKTTPKSTANRTKTARALKKMKSDEQPTTEPSEDAVVGAVAEKTKPKKSRARAKTRPVDGGTPAEGVGAAGSTDKAQLAELPKPDGRRHGVRAETKRSRKEKPATSEDDFEATLNSLDGIEDVPVFGSWSVCKCQGKRQNVIVMEGTSPLWEQTDLDFAGSVLGEEKPPCDCGKGRKERLRRVLFPTDPVTSCAAGCRPPEGSDESILKRMIFEDEYMKIVYVCLVCGYTSKIYTSEKTIEWALEEIKKNSCCITPEMFFCTCSFLQPTLCLSPDAARKLVDGEMGDLPEIGRNPTQEGPKMKIVPKREPDVDATDV